jgi:hypothetical protein
MSTKYHISPTSGRPNKCYANTKPCPLGGPEDHFPTREKAVKAIEKRAEEEFGKVAKPLKKVKSAPVTPKVTEEEEFVEINLDELEADAFASAYAEAELEADEEEEVESTEKMCSDCGTKPAEFKGKCWDCEDAQGTCYSCGRTFYGSGEECASCIASYDDGADDFGDLY